MTIINTEHAPGAIGPYSQAYESKEKSDSLFFESQIPKKSLKT